MAIPAPTNEELDAYWLPGRTRDEAATMMAQHTASCVECGRVLYILPTDEKHRWVCRGDCAPLSMYARKDTVIVPLGDAPAMKDMVFGVFRGGSQESEEEPKLKYGKRK